MLTLSNLPADPVYMYLSLNRNTFTINIISLSISNYVLVLYYIRVVGISVRLFN